MLKCDHQFFQSKATEGTGNEPSENCVYINSFVGSIDNIQLTR